MKPEDLDKLFNKRLGKINPTPSADLWSRLQDRIEDELPAKEEKRPIMMWARSYVVAAAVTVVLSAGAVYYQVQQDVQTPSETVAQADQIKPADKVTEPIQADKWAIKGVDAANMQQADEPVAEEYIASAEAGSEDVPETLPEQESFQQPEKKKVAPAVKFNNKLVTVAGNNKVKTEPEQAYETSAETPVSFASAKTDMNAAPVEIIIKRSVAASTPEEVDTEEPDSEFRKKQKLVKNIFRQVKKLSNGEPVSLAAVGVHADRIALETQIGNQKISKVINL